MFIIMDTTNGASCFPNFTWSCIGVNRISACNVITEQSDWYLSLFESNTLEAQLCMKSKMMQKVLLFQSTEWVLCLFMHALCQSIGLYMSPVNKEYFGKRTELKSFRFYRRKVWWSHWAWMLRWIWPISSHISNLRGVEFSAFGRGSNLHP